MTYMTASQSAQAMGVSVSTIYRRVRKGVLRTTRENGRIMVEVETVPIPKPDPVAQAQVAVQPEPGGPAQHSGGGGGGGQRELMPRQGGRIAFFQGMTWL